MRLGKDLRIVGSKKRLIGKGNTGSGGKEEQHLVSNRFK